MKICFFGRYDNKYSRNRILISGLKQNGVEVIECRTELTGIKKYFDLIKKHKQIKNDYDVLFVAFPGWHAMILAKFLSRKPIIFDAFLSVYDSTVWDRKNTSRYSPKAWYFWILDWLSCKLADKVLLDTNEHIKYFVKEFGIKKEKFERVFVGSDTSVFYPKEKKNINKKFTVLHHGNVVPLQGVKFILESARLLEKNKNIQFNIVGSRIKKWYEKKCFYNVNFIDNLKYRELPDIISQSDICLGIFGNTDKTQRVIPNKVYEYSATKMPTITADTPAIRELFDEKDLYLIPTAEPEALAEAILKFKKDLALREKLAENSYNKFMSNCTPNILGRQLTKMINELSI